MSGYSWSCRSDESESPFDRLGICRVRLKRENSRSLSPICGPPRRPNLIRPMRGPMGEEQIRRLSRQTGPDGPKWRCRAALRARPYRRTPMGEQRSGQGLKARRNRQIYMLCVKPVTILQAGRQRAPARFQALAIQPIGRVLLSLGVGAIMIDTVAD